MQEPSEIITSTNLRDINHDRTPSISPSTIRNHHRNTGAISNSLFYHNMFGPESTTPMNSNIPTSTTPGIEQQHYH